MLIFISTLILICCAPKKNVINWMDSNMLSKTAIQSYEFDLNRYEFDSICNIENIPSELSLWIITPFKNEATKEKFNKYLFVVKNQVDSLMDDVYVTEPIINLSDTVFHLEIRKTIFLY